MAALDQLPPDQQAVIGLLVRQGRSYDQVATMLGVDAAAVRRRARQAVSQLGDGPAPAPADLSAISDYLLGQAEESARFSTLLALTDSAGDRHWARSVAAQLAPIAADYGIAKTPVTFAGISMVALTFALTLDRVLDGLGRPLFGILSDRIGREQTMGIAFSIAALMLFLLGVAGRDPLVFVLASAFYFLVFGEIYSLFPATCGDTFGPRYATTNAGLLYTAKGVGALLVPIASGIAKVHGWQTVFYLTVGLNVTAAILAVLVLQPVRRRFIADSFIMR